MSADVPYYDPRFQVIQSGRKLRYSDQYNYNRCIIVTILTFSQFMLISVPRNLENAPVQVLTQLSHCTKQVFCGPTQQIPSFVFNQGSRLSVGGQMQIEAFSLEIYFYSLKPRYFHLQEKNYKYMYMLFLQDMLFVIKQLEKNFKFNPSVPNAPFLYPRKI